MKLDVIRVHVVPDNETLTLILRERDRHRPSRRFLIAVGASFLFGSAVLAFAFWYFYL
jgi:hypothetical protein